MVSTPDSLSVVSLRIASATRSSSSQYSWPKLLNTSGVSTKTCSCIRVVPRASTSTGPLTVCTATMPGLLAIDDLVDGPDRCWRRGPGSRTGEGQRHRRRQPAGPGPQRRQEQRGQPAGRGRGGGRRARADAAVGHQQQDEVVGDQVGAQGPGALGPPRQPGE